MTSWSPSRSAWCSEQSWTGAQVAPCCHSDWPPSGCWTPSTPAGCCYLGRLRAAHELGLRCCSGCLAVCCRLQYLEVVCLAALRTTCEGGGGWDDCQADFPGVSPTKEVVCSQGLRHSMTVVYDPVGATEPALWWSEMFEEGLEAVSTVLREVRVALASR